MYSHHRLLDDAKYTVFTVDVQSLQTADNLECEWVGLELLWIGLIESLELPFHGDSVCNCSNCSRVIGEYLANHLDEIHLIGREINVHLAWSEVH